MRLRHAQKSAKGAPPYSLFVNRPLGRVLAAAAYQMGLTPNQVTYISAAMHLRRPLVLALAPATWPVGLLVTVMLVLGYALDSADGQLARLRGGGSLLGEWLDHMIDSVKVAALHLAVLVSLYRNFDLDPPGWRCRSSSRSLVGAFLRDDPGRPAGPGPARPGGAAGTAAGTGRIGSRPC